VNRVFDGASNALGEFESGLTAAGWRHAGRHRSWASGPAWWCHCQPHATCCE
jgi:hypothetical protein